MNNLTMIKNLQSLIKTCSEKLFYKKIYLWHVFKDWRRSWFGFIGDKKRARRQPLVDFVEFPDFNSQDSPHPVGAVTVSALFSIVEPFSLLLSEVCFTLVEVIALQSAECYN